MSDEQLNLTLRIWRQNGQDDPGEFRNYQLDGVSPHMSFLEMLDVTFRRDPENLRPRINKRNSAMDRQQKSDGTFYLFDLDDDDK